MRAVDLLPRDDRAKRKLNPVAAVAIGGATVVASALAAMIVLASGTVSARQAEVADLQAELLVIPKPAAPAQADNSEQLAGEASARLTALATALSERVAWDRVLRRFALVLPEDVWLTSLNAQAPAATPAGAAPAASPGAAPTGFTITGYTYSHEAVARLLSRLGLIADLENVQLQRSALTLGNAKVVEFTIVAGVRGGSST